MKALQILLFIIASLIILWVIFGTPLIEKIIFRLKTPEDDEISRMAEEVGRTAQRRVVDLSSDLTETKRQIKTLDAVAGAYIAKKKSVPRKRQPKEAGTLQPGRSIS